MVTSKVLNPERLKKIEGNRERLASGLTCLKIIFKFADNFFSLQV